MQLKELIESRYSVRAYLPQPVEKEKVDYILECARLSPSACNLQPWRFYVVTDKAVMARIHESYNRDWFATAPMHIVVCKDTSESWKRTTSDNKDHADIDAAIASEHICLAVANVGLGTCWICNFKPDELTDALHLPDHIEPIAIFPLGYIDEEKSKPTEKKRKPAADIIEWI
ncbi:nitroreductase [Dysgonomonas sp. PFB1-18]|uniref:nitroreductase family protein n=1 Tax=unclassified Dysgonomonas TaxID=2630389 RepID=UPI0024741606|nr:MULTISPECIES: nitroreductase family protein [unclassified Dysgonomonas]MDL2303155.1 nitroreductase family protein [Dysgonomonas sp. OttesenSCG-928-D17]MDH6308249.1 nitroreductase [Dysgonomonas sp. PF1-14]MDH6338312.1 nitroreductase [Dysgonomonas sp. PF1-16]MDH6379809.1 nitroreductase [Dysgonomonas sp. PFB1-18]MDH6397101.1 nitroreductase [Dysgonomonas sp. PF1-23]